MQKKPMSSVIVVTNTVEVTAGSMRKRSSVKGTNTPDRPAMIELMNIAAPSTRLNPMS